jgi:hypothetical protein
MRILCDRGPIILHTPRRVTQRRIELAWQSSLAVAAAVPCGADCAALDAERFTAYGPGFIVASDAVFGVLSFRAAWVGPPRHANLSAECTALCAVTND